MAQGEPVIGAFEIHIFVEPLDPPAEVIEQFRAACAQAQPPMKALLLCLDYEQRGYVGVLQSSRYVQGDVAIAVQAAHADAEVLRRAGLRVIREKVEALASDAGVPHSATQAANAPPGRYFEFHVLIDGRDRALGEADMIALRDLSRKYAAALKTPVPLSYNALKPAQRFLNLRAHGSGLEQAMQPVQALEREIAALGALQVKKIIAEYICFDTNRAVDNGWLEPL